MKSKPKFQIVKICSKLTILCICKDIIKVLFSIFRVMKMSRCLLKNLLHNINGCLPKGNLNYNFFKKLKSLRFYLKYHII